MEKRHLYEIDLIYKSTRKGPIFLARRWPKKNVVYTTCVHVESQNILYLTVLQAPCSKTMIYPKVPSNIPCSCISRLAKEWDCVKVSGAFTCS